MAAIDFGQLAISNQPSFHYPFLFSYIGKPEMAQPLLKQLMQTFDASLAIQVMKTMVACLLGIFLIA